MELVMPGIGLLFWMLVSFSLLLLILKKFAWKPILESLKQRQQSIDDALNSAQKAKVEMAKLQSDNEKVLIEAKQERENLIKEARQIKEKIIGEAKQQADIEAKKMIEAARTNIENEKAAAINEIKSTIVSLSIEIASKILERELSSKESQEALATDLLKKVTVN